MATNNSDPKITINGADPIEVIDLTGDEPIPVVGGPSSDTDSEVEILETPPKKVVVIDLESGTETVVYVPPPRIMTVIDVDVDSDGESVIYEPQPGPSSSTSQNVPAGRGKELELDSVSRTSNGTEKPEASSRSKTYRPKIMISQGIFTDRELDNLLRSDKLEVQVLDNMVPEPSIKFRHVRPIENYPGATDMDDIILLPFQVDKNLPKFRAQIPRFGIRSGETVTKWLTNLESRCCPGAKFILLVQGMDAYLNQIPLKEKLDLALAQSLSEKEAKDVGQMLNKIPNICRREIRTVLTEVLQHTKVDFRCFETASELAKLVKGFAKQIGEDYGKKVRRQALHWKPPGDNFLHDIGNVPSWPRK